MPRHATDGLSSSSKTESMLSAVKARGSPTRILLAPEGRESVVNGVCEPAVRDRCTGSLSQNVGLTKRGGSSQHISWQMGSSSKRTLRALRTLRVQDRGTIDSVLVASRRAPAPIGLSIEPSRGRILTMHGASGNIVPALDRR